MINRRGLLTGLGALIAAPAIVRAASMPVRTPPLEPFDCLTLDDVRAMRDILEGSIGEYAGVILKYDNGVFEPEWITNEEYYRDFNRDTRAVVLPQRISFD